MTDTQAKQNPDRQDQTLELFQQAAELCAQAASCEEYLLGLLNGLMEITGAGRGLIAGCDLGLHDQDPSRRAEACFVSAGRNLDLSALDQPEFQAWTQASLPAETDLGAVLCLPLFAFGQRVGWLVLAEPGHASPFSAADLAIAQQVASQAALAISSCLNRKLLEEANQSKAKFVSVVTHELRIPMTSIKGYTEMMQKGMAGPLNEMQGEFLKVIHNNVERMAVLVSDLSDLSHVETGRLTLQLSPASMQAAVEEVARSFRPRLEEKGLQLETDVPEDLPQVSADYGRMVQVLNNLMNNAFKYNRQGGQIRVEAAAEPGWVRVQVSDTGIGIRPEDQDKLFTPFFRSDDPDVREQPGWGLGLSIAKRLVDLMGGQIGSQGELKEGSVFWFTLPRAEDSNE